ncbi:DnaB-like helicase N-terminal domain-containing protein [Streptomyces sp. NRRL S-337]|uniref:DnaB-like helicase N-terminal domain-containing protein n=1 Tax=Streptomyces sp. NRRL S-337 TaxID=1463900 RepID=UPI001F2A89E7|nr:DnaB-like helicase N-terminal domain-containing protein [Streptomyces sp. NRRL S-337]
MQPPAPSGASTEQPQPADEQILADEEFLLGCLSARPEKLRDVVGWLQPGDFADAGHRQIYRPLGALHHRGEPIDQLTVLWETQRRGALTVGSLDTERVLRICDPSASAGTADYYGEQIVQASLVRTTDPGLLPLRPASVRPDPAPGPISPPSAFPRRPPRLGLRLPLDRHHRRSPS